LLAAAAVACAPSSQPEFTKVSKAACVSNTQTSWNLRAPKPMPACTSAIFMKILSPLSRRAATPWPPAPPSQKALTP
jgi:hypothetical protein